MGWLTHPDYRRRGIGSAYWAYLNSEILPQRTVSGLITDARNTIPDAGAFLENRGFERQQTETRSQLDLTTFDSTRYVKQTAAMTDRGIILKPLAELLEEDADHMQKLLVLELMVREDEPHVEPPAPISAEMFRNYYMSSDNYYPGGWFIAVDGEQYAGWCAVLPDRQNSEQMKMGTTVIDRAYRRQGLATAMKAHALHHAQQRGAKRITTTNASTNPMLALNKQLGFEPIYETYEYKKSL